jgi:NitT/TauT family transport system substrate-binding protein
VVREGAQIAGPDGLHHKRVATPQLGNTQDIALRVWLDAHGLRPRELGGDVQVIPIANPDILSLMKSGQLDAAWVPEPWLTRLVHEAGGRLLIDERDLWPARRFPTALVVVSRKLLDTQPERVRQFVAAHVQVVQWIRSHSDEARTLVAEALKKRGQKPLPPDELAEAWSRVEVMADPLEPALRKLEADATKLGFLPRGGRGGLVDGRFLPSSGDGG